MKTRTTGCARPTNPRLRLAGQQGERQRSDDRPQPSLWLQPTGTPGCRQLRCACMLLAACRQLLQGHFGHRLLADSTHRITRCFAAGPAAGCGGSAHGGGIHAQAGACNGGTQGVPLCYHMQSSCIWTCLLLSRMACVLYVWFAGRQRSYTHTLIDTRTLVFQLQAAELKMPEPQQGMGRGRTLAAYLTVGFCQHIYYLPGCLIHCPDCLLAECAC